MPFPANESGLGSLIRYRGKPLFRFKSMRDHYDGVVGFHLLGSRIVVVHDPSFIQQVLVRQHESFVRDSFSQELSLVLGRGLLTDEGDHHKRQRALIAPSLHPSEVARYVSIMAQCTLTYASRLRDGEVCDVRGAMMQLTLDILVRSLFGHHFDDYALVERELERVMQAFRPWSELFRRATPEWVPLPSRRAIATGRRRLHGLIDRLVAEKRATGTGQDLLSRLISQTDATGAMADEDLRDQVVTLFLAGHETTALGLAYLLRLLALHPASRLRVEAEIDALDNNADLNTERLHKLEYTQAAFKESLRLFPPAWLLGRRAVKPCTVAGWQVEPDMELLMPVYTLQRDPRWFENPESFVPERFLPGGEIEQKRVPRFAYAPFGGGPRVCVGGHFAQMEAMVILATLLRRFRFEWLDARFDVEPSITLRPKYPMPMRVQARR